MNAYLYDIPSSMDHDGKLAKSRICNCSMLLSFVHTTSEILLVAAICSATGIQLSSGTLPNAISARPGPWLVFLYVLWFVSAFTFYNLTDVNHRPDKYLAAGIICGAALGVVLGWSLTQILLLPVGWGITLGLVLCVALEGYRWRQSATSSGERCGQDLPEKR